MSELKKTEKQSSAVSTTKFNKEILNKLISRVTELQNTGELVLPPNYSAPNALQAAWLILLDVEDRNKRKAIEVCTPHSISNALLKMVTSGLSVVKDQGYFVVYGESLVFEDSYFGKIAIAKRTANVKEVRGVTIYKDDIFKYVIDLDTGKKKIVEHEQSLGNINMSSIVGAYAIVTYNDGTSEAEVMTMDQIKTSWEMGGSKGTSKAHKNFTDQMCEKTVIGRALKIENNSTDDKSLSPVENFRPTSAASTHMNLEVNDKSVQEAVTINIDEQQESAIKPNYSFHHEDEPQATGYNSEATGYNSESEKKTQANEDAPIQKLF